MNMKLVCYARFGTNISHIWIYVELWSKVIHRSIIEKAGRPREKLYTRRVCREARLLMSPRASWQLYHNLSNPLGSWKKGTRVIITDISFTDHDKAMYHVLEQPGGTSQQEIQNYHIWRGNREARRSSWGKEEILMKKRKIEEQRL